MVSKKKSHVPEEPQQTAPEEPQEVVCEESQEEVCEAQPQNESGTVNVEPEEVEIQEGIETIETGAKIN